MINKRVVSGLKHGLIKRAPKKNYSEPDLSSLRDISLLSCVYKLFMKCLLKCITPRLTENVIGFWQRDYLNKQDRQELIFCVKTAIEDFKHMSSKFYGLFIDFRDTFDSLDQSHMIKNLAACGIEETYCKIVLDIYQDSHFEVICDEGLSKEFALKSGCKTGDPASPIFFILNIDKSLHGPMDIALDKLSILDEHYISPILVAGYVADILLISLLENIMMSMVEKLKDNIRNNQLHVRSDKCAIFYECRSGNRWFKAKKDVPPSIEFNDELVPVLQCHGKFVYLGKPLTVAGEFEEHSKEIIEEYSNWLHLISISVAPVSIKIEALEVIALSKIVHHSANTHFNEDQLNELDTLLTKTICSILCLNHSTTVCNCFQPEWKGGLGIRKPSVVYRSMRITHLLAMLNHQEVNIRFVARNSLRLDMEKCGVRRSSEERNFLGFKCNNMSIIETNIKGGFGVASNWSQLNKLAGKLRVSLTFENVEVEELMDAGNVVLLYENGDVIRYGSNKALRKKLTLQQLETELSDIKQLKMQGT